MSLLFGACVSPSVDPPLPRHCPCPAHDDCDNRKVGHCGRPECEADAPEQTCTCLCASCRHADAPICDEPEQHRLCTTALADARADYTKGDEHE